jgi:hypothetical protein
MTWLAERLGSTATGTVGETIRVPGPRRWDTESYAAIARWLGRTPSSEGPSLNTRSMDSFEGRELFDSNGYKIGDIESVFTDDGLEFALVKSGLFGTIRRLVPLNDVCESDDELVVPYSKDKVKLAPPAEADMRLSQRARERLS